MTPESDLEPIWNGDPGAWRAIHSELYGVAFDAARRCCPERPPLTQFELDDVAEDAVELTFLKIRQVERSRKKLRAYVAAVARNKAADMHRAKAGKRNIAKEMVSLEEKLAAGDFKELGGSQQPDADLLKAELAALLADLIDPQDLELALSKQDGVPEKVIAAEHGWGEKSVGNRHQQALRRIKRALASDPRVAELGYKLDANE